MTKIMRFEPMREMVTLREAMDRLFDDAFMRPTSLTGTNWQAPAVDMYQTDDEIIVKAALPRHQSRRGADLGHGRGADPQG